MPANPNGRPNSDVLGPWVNGMDVTRRPAGKWIVDFGCEPECVMRRRFTRRRFTYIAQDTSSRCGSVNRRNSRRAEHWWRHVAPRSRDMCERSTDCRVTSRRRASPSTGCSYWLDARICVPRRTTHRLSPATTTRRFGILHSRFHEAWSLRLGTWLGKGNDPRYTPTTTFETFPFPEGLSPDVPARLAK